MQAGANKLLLVMGSETGGGQRPGAGDLKHGSQLRVTLHLTQKAEIVKTKSLSKSVIPLTIPAQKEEILSELLTCCMGELTGGNTLSVLPTMLTWPLVWAGWYW